ncbi:7-methyl-GTP pyrophosphatase [Linum perenne]
MSGNRTFEFVQALKATGGDGVQLAGDSVGSGGSGEVEEEGNPVGTTDEWVGVDSAAIASEEEGVSCLHQILKQFVIGETLLQSAVDWTEDRDSEFGGVPSLAVNGGDCASPAAIQNSDREMLKQSFKIILGSASMARRRILTEMGYEFTLMTADIDEKSIRKDKPEELVMALAEAKAEAIIAKMLNTNEMKNYSGTTLLITADTVVVYKGIVREKPTSPEEARVDQEMVVYTGYSGGHAGVVGSVLVTNLATGSKKGGWESAEVYFHEIPKEVIDSLIEERITFKVAGGLTLEHPLTMPFVEAVVGNIDAVSGLPVELTKQLIAEVLQPVKS